MRVRAAQVHRGENSWRGTRWGVGPACAAVPAALPPQARSEVKSHAGPVWTSRAEGGGGFFAHRAFAVVRVVPKVAIDGHIKIFSFESWARQNIGTRDAPMLFDGRGPCRPPPAPRTGMQILKGGQGSYGNADLERQVMGKSRKRVLFCFSPRLRLPRQTWGRAAIHRVRTHHAARRAAIAEPAAPRDGFQARYGFK